MDAKRGLEKRGNYISIMVRWQTDEVYRESQLDGDVCQVLYISEIDISNNALYRQRERYNNTVYMRGVDSNKTSRTAVSTTWL